MGLIIKHTLKSMRAHKMRTFLLLFCVGICSLAAMLCFDMSGSLEQAVKANNAKAFGKADIIVTASYDLDDDFAKGIPESTVLELSTGSTVFTKHIVGTYDMLTQKTCSISGVDIPKHYMRSMNRLAGMLELIDDEFSHIRVELADYRRRVQALVASGNLNDAPLDGETYRSYLNLNPFHRLNKTIAAINQAEIQEVSLMPYLEVFKGMGFRTLGDVDRFIKEYSDPAFQLASFQISLTDLDIISSSLGPQNLCIVYVLINGGGTAGLRKLFDTLNGPNESNETMAEYIIEQARELPFMNEKKK